ncbi:MAG: putative peptidoglycan binding domain [Actinomycetota bacterium]
MKRSVVVVFLALIVGCSGSSDVVPSSTTGEATTTAAPATSAAPTTTTTTLPPDETLAECPTADIAAQYGKRMRMLRCTQTWALGSFDTDTWKCGPDGCTDTRVFNLRGGTWVNTATCYLDSPLTEKRRRCYVPDVGLATDAELPPSNIACVIWPLNADPKWVDETNCPLSDEAINRILSTKCDGWTPNEFLPLEPCDSGPLVRKVQRALRDAGYPVQVDGFNGPGTVRAIALFQRDKDLRRSGIVDQTTLDTLGVK